MLAATDNNAQSCTYVWHDPAGAYADDPAQVTLPEGAVLVREDELTPFICKLRVNAFKRAVVYRRRGGGVWPADWLADIEASGAVFDPAGTTAVSEEAPGDEQPASDAVGTTPAGTVAMAAAVPVPTAPDPTHETPAAVAPAPPTTVSVSAEPERPATPPTTSPATPLPASDELKLLLEQPFITKRELKQVIGHNNRISNEIKRLKREGSLLDYDANTLIGPAGLRELDIMHDDIQAFVKAVSAFAASDGNRYFTVSRLLSCMADQPLVGYELDPRFYISLLAARQRVFNSARFGDATLFVPVGFSPKPPAFVTYLVQQGGSIYVDDLLDVLENDYGIHISPQQLSNTVRQSKLYFNTKIRRVFESKDQFVKEIE